MCYGVQRFALFLNRKGGEIHNPDYFRPIWFTLFLWNKSFTLLIVCNSLHCFTFLGKTSAADSLKWRFIPESKMYISIFFPVVVFIHLNCFGMSCRTLEYIGYRYICHPSNIMELDGPRRYSGFLLCGDTTLSHRKKIVPPENHSQGQWIIFNSQVRISEERHAMKHFEDICSGTSRATSQDILVLFHPYSLHPGIIEPVTFVNKFGNKEDIFTAIILKIF